MNTCTQYGGALAGAIVLAFAGTAFAQGEDANIRSEVAALRAEVAQLRAAQGEQWLTDQRAEEIRGLVQDVLADADTRASLLQSGMTAGWNGGPFIASADGNFKLQFGATIQVRFVYNNQDQSSDDDRWGFENRRTRLRFKGNFLDPTWMYFMQGDFGLSGTFGLLDAYIDKDLGNGWTFRAGKFMLPFSREPLVSHAKPLAVERSIITNYFSPGRSQGVEFLYSADRWRFMGAISDGGLGSLGGATASALTYDTEYALTARVEWLVEGTWAQFGDWTSFNGEEFAFLLGGGVHWQESEYGESAMGAETEVFRWTADASLEFGGANLAATIYGNHTEMNVPAATGVDQYGFMVQGGVFLNDDLEVFGRYEWADEDSSVDDLSVITVGFNRYFSGHNIKWSTDLNYGLNEVSTRRTARHSQPTSAGVLTRLIRTVRVLLARNEQRPALRGRSFHARCAATRSRPSGGRFPLPTIIARSSRVDRSSWSTAHSTKRSSARCARPAPTLSRVPTSRPCPSQRASGFPAASASASRWIGGSSRAMPTVPRRPMRPSMSAPTRC
jgi:hypothetical protein